MPDMNSARVHTGLERLLSEKGWLSRLAGKRVGLVAHPASILPDLSHAARALLEAGVNLTALFGPEHGYSGAAPDAQAVGFTHDRLTGLPVFSLYGHGFAPPAEGLAMSDLLIYDMQDIGCRFYTYISTLFYVLQSAGQTGLPVWVCDRPNPIGGLAVEGPGVEDAYRSFIGIADIPIRHGMTAGELALLFNDRLPKPAELEIISMSGWQRRMTFAETGLPWVAPSPGMPSLQTALVYPGTCFFEGVNLSDGRGTAQPFELAGAPWLDAHALAASLNALDLPGVRYRAAWFTPASGKFKGQLCAGVQTHVTDHAAFRSVFSGLSMLQACMRQQPERATFLPDSWEGRYPHFDLLAGSPALRAALQAHVPVTEITQGWRAFESDFSAQRLAYLLYHANS